MCLNYFDLHYKRYSLPYFFKKLYDKNVALQALQFYKPLSQIKF